MGAKKIAIVDRITLEIMSTSERAYLELLGELPQEETFHMADVIMEGLVNISPRRMQTLLEQTKSIKVKRLFFFFADRHQHQWLTRIAREHIDLGSGKLMLVKGGSLIRFTKLPYRKISLRGMGVTYSELYRKQAMLLVKALPHVAKEACFALKGGTAINLFIRNLPRLSVDIDLTYLPVAERRYSLSEIDTALKRIGQSIQASGSTIKITESAPSTQKEIRGCPISISVYEGNTSDSTTLLPQVERLQQDFNLKSVILVGDRGMISEVQLKTLRERSGVDWITALKSGAIRKLCDECAIQLTLFDEQNLFEFAHADFPGERLIACRNPELAHHRHKTRTSLLEATTQALTQVQNMVAKGTLKEADKIGIRVGRGINQYKMAKHIKLDIADGMFRFEVDMDRVDKEAELDGIYVIRCSLQKEARTANDIVLDYKSLSRVERAFRSIKTTDLKVRPIYHYNEQRVRTHLLICMLAYYVKWHMMEAWRPLLFADDPLEEKRHRERSQIKTNT